MPVTPLGGRRARYARIILAGRGGRGSYPTPGRWPKLEGGRKYLYYYSYAHFNSGTRFPSQLGNTGQQASIKRPQPPKREGKGGREQAV